MGKSIRASRVKRKKPGPPKTTGPGVQVVVRLHQPMLGSIDQWAEQNDVTRAEAIRRLVDAGLSNNAEGARTMIERAMTADRKE
jgi:hypothetical protein